MEDMKTAVAIKSVATGVSAAAAFGLTPLAVAAAIAGAIASLHFEPPAKGSGVWRVLGQIAAFALLAALLATLTVAWWPSDTVPLPARAGLLGIFANPCYLVARSWLDKKREAGNVPGER